jgi:hypothetical protein
LRITLIWAHHVDATGFNGKVSTSTAPNQRVVFSGILIRSFSDDEQLDAPAEGWRMIFPIGRPWDVMAEG